MLVGDDYSFSVDVTCLFYPGMISLGEVNRSYFPQSAGHNERLNRNAKMEALYHQTNDAQYLKPVLQTSQDRWVRQTQERERDELLGQTFTDAYTSIRIDETLQLNTNLFNTHKSIDDLLGSGSSILSGLRDQRGTLKGTQKRMLNVLNMLGLSNTAMRFIERRATQDKFIMIGGMFLVCVFMFLVKWYLG